MPTYAYACTACDHRFEAQQSFTDAALTECPECQGRLRKLFHTVGIVFKGSGFYRTDSRAAEGSKTSEAPVPAGAGTADSSGSGSKPSGSPDPGSGGNGSGGNGSGGNGSGKAGTGKNGSGKAGSGGSGSGGSGGSRDGSSGRSGKDSSGGSKAMSGSAA